MSRLTRADLDALPTYVPGRTVPGAIKLASNEVPYGPLTSVRVPNTPGHAHDLPAMAAAITERTRLVLVCNPNNPTGTAIHKADLDAFLDRVPSDVLVVIDEAYREFVTDPEVPDALRTYGDRPNVVILRTLSKAWGLAGLRIGWLV